MRLPSIEIWLYQDDLALLGPLIAELPPSQQHRALQLNNQRQREFVIGRSLLRLAIEQNSHSNNWSIKERTNSSPIIEHPSQQFEANISHSKGWIALAFCENYQNSQASIGLDIELVKPRQEFAAATFFCGSSQLRELNAAITNEDKSRYFSQLWTQKEAYFKAHRQNIWNSKIRSIAFNKNKPKEAPPPELIQTAFYGQSLVLSVFCNTGYDIDTRLIQKVSPSSAESISTLKLDWQSYSIEYEDQE